MSYWEAILLGFVQGATEFLPISSSGHLVLIEHVLGRTTENIAFNVALHAGTLLSILVAFRNDILLAVKNRRLAVAIIVATIPVVPVGLLLKDFIENTLNTPFAAACGLLLTAAYLFLIPRFDRGTRPLEEVRLKDAVVVGLFQAIAPAPGVSRSGSTIFGGLVSGLTRDAAARFAFLVAIPALCGAIVLYGRKLVSDHADLQPGPTLTGMVVSFVVGLCAIHLLMKVIARRQLRGFAWYCLGLGTAVLVAGVLSPASNP